MKSTRYTLGPSFGTVAFQTSDAEPQALEPSAPVLADVEVTASGIENGVATVTVPAHDPATHQSPVEVLAFAVPEGSTVPASADDYVASAFAFGVNDSFTVTAEGFDVGVKLPDVPDGNYLVQIVLGFSS